MRLLKACLLMLLPVLLQSCEKDIDVKVPAHQPVLVLNSVTVAGNEITAEVSRSVAILNYTPNKDLIIKDATVLLYDNGQLADTLRFHSDLETYVSKVRSAAGHMYRLEVRKDGYETITAMADVPETVAANITRLQNVYTGRYNAMMDEVITGFRDIAGPQPDFYRIRMIKTADSQQYYAGGCIESMDRALENLLDETIGEEKCYSGEGMYLKDIFFNGSYKNASFFVDHNEFDSVQGINGTPAYITIQFDHLSADYFQYLKTTAYLIHNNDNPFAEPANAYTNVKKGYGIFTIVARTEKKF